LFTEKEISYMPIVLNDITYRYTYNGKTFYNPLCVLERAFGQKGIFEKSLFNGLTGAYLNNEHFTFRPNIRIRSNDTINILSSDKCFDYEGLLLINSTDILLQAGLLYYDEVYRFSFPEAMEHFKDMNCFKVFKLQNHMLVKGLVYANATVIQNSINDLIRKAGNFQSKYNYEESFRSYVSGVLNSLEETHHVISEESGHDGISDLIIAFRDSLIPNSGSEGVNIIIEFKIVDEFVKSGKSDKTDKGNKINKKKPPKG
jgi:hypothetical protein